MSTFKVGDIVNPCDPEVFQREFGLAPLKQEGQYVGYIDGSKQISADVHSSRWIEVCYDDSDFNELGIDNETIEVICADIESQFNHLNEDQKYIAITALINRLIPESGY